MTKENKKISYLEKLKDPRWQKKRLKVLERDQWECVSCGSSNHTLCVHHLYYEKDKNPWEYDLNALVTLCQECHNEEILMIQRQLTLLVEIMHRLFLSCDIRLLALSFYSLLEEKMSMSELSEFAVGLAILMDSKHGRDFIVKLGGKSPYEARCITRDLLNF